MYIYNILSKENSLYHDTLFLLGIDRNDTTTFPLEDFIRSANNWYRKANQWIWNSVGEWEYDDTNYSNFAIATTDIVANQSDYSIPTTTQKIERVEYKNSNGDWIRLKQIDKASYNTSLENLSDAGTQPDYYDPQGYSIVLYPTPEDAVTGGLKLWYSRNISKFTSSDTTKEPGFVEDFHRIISIGAALDFSTVVNNNKKTELRESLKEYREQIETFYGSRNRDARIIIKKNNFNHK